MRQRNDESVKVEMERTGFRVITLEGEVSDEHKGPREAPTSKVEVPKEHSNTGDPVPVIIQSGQQLKAPEILTDLRRKFFCFLARKRLPENPVEVAAFAHTCTLSTAFRERHSLV